MAPNTKAVKSSSAKQKEDFDVYTRLLDKDEIGRIIRKSRRSIEVLMFQGILPYIKIGRSVRFRLRDVERALEKLTVKEAAK